MRFFYVFLVVLMTSFIVKSQNTVWFLNGDKMQIGNYTVDTSAFEITYHNKKNKEKIIDIDNVFSITDGTGKEVIYYIPVKVYEDKEEIFEVEQMRSFVQGEFDADKEHKGLIAFGTGLTTGLVGGSTVLLGGYVFFSPLLPLTDAVTVGLTKPKESKVIQLHPEKKHDIHYIRGYQESASGKRTNAAIKGGLIGLGIGVLSGVLYNSFNK